MRIFLDIYERRGGNNPKRMRDWGEFCLTQKNDPEARRVSQLALFGEYHEPNFSSETRANVLCPLCRDEGVVFASDCRPQTNNHHGRTMPGWVACKCKKGIARNLAIADAGKPKRQEGRRKRDDF